MSTSQSHFGKPAIGMQYSFQLTDELYELTNTLTKKVRLLSHSQLERTFFANEKNATKKAGAAIKALVDAGFIVHDSAMLHPEIELNGPLCRYSPGDEAPDFRSIASTTRGRWKEAPVMSDFIFATKFAKRELGGYIGGKKPRPSEIRHDIHVAQIYLRLAENEPELAGAWRPEEYIREHLESAAQKIPDAIIETSQPVIIEFGGAYSRAKLESIHASQKENKYEIW